MCISFLSQILLNLELDTPKRLDVFLGHPFWMLKFCLILANDFSADLSRCAKNLLEFDKCAHPKPQCVGVARIEIFLFTHQIHGCANLQFVRTLPQLCIKRAKSADINLLVQNLQKRRRTSFKLVEN